MSVHAALEESAPREAQRSGFRAQPDPQLLAELADLDEREQALLARLLERAKRDSMTGARRELDELGLVHRFLEVDLEKDDLSVLQNITAYTAPPVIKQYPEAPRFELPRELLPLEHSLGEVLVKRASRRDFSKGPLSQAELASLLYCSYGIRSTALAYNVKGFPSRFVPSTGGLQAVEVYLTVNAVEGLEQRLYHYDTIHHALEQLDRGNFRRKVVQACIRQDWVDAASVVFFLTCDMRKLFWKYGRRGYRFVHVDVGILAQTLHLVANALRLRSCMVAGYSDQAVHQLLEIDGRQEFVGLLLTVGRKPWEAGPPAAKPNLPVEEV